MNQLKVELSAQNILNGLTNPIPVLPSLPAGRAYLVHDFALDVQPGTTAFDNAAGIVVTSDTSSPDNGQLTCGGVDSSVPVFTTGLKNGNIQNHIHPGAGLFLQACYDSITGDGTATAYILYSVIDL